MKRIESVFASIAAIALFAMMWLTVVDVIGRKFLANSLVGAVELTEIFMLLTIFIGLPLTSRAGEHIVFDLLDQVLPANLLRFQRALSQLLTSLVLIGASLVVGKRAARTLEYGDTTAQLEIPLGHFHYLIAVLLMVTAGIHLLLFARETWLFRERDAQ
ncbi:MAG: TRAP transporter small permease [Burkholderiaceae bacterium]